jgi:putative ABC transport system permease protein
VGIRKVLGSHQKILVAQFLFESIFLCLVASIISIAFLFGFIPRFNFLLGTHLEFVSISDPLIMVMIVVFIFLVGILSGLYPALAIASLQPSRVLKGSFKTSKRGTWMRDSMIAFQFLISIVMIAGSLVASEQMDYLQNKNLGFNKSNLLVIKQPYRLGQNYQAFLNEVKSISSIEKVAGVNTVPGEFHGSNVFKISDPTIPDLRVNSCNVSDDYLDVLEIEIIAGRGYSADFNDSSSVILNESAVQSMVITPEKALGLKLRSLVGTTTEFTVVGVVKDFNYLSLHTEISPIAIFNYNEIFSSGNTVIRFRTENTTDLLKTIEEKWTALSQAPFSFSFLDQDLQRQYVADQNTATLFKIFTSIAIIMSCVGLFGLATYVQNQRSKEMSIRKVSGASVMQIIMVFSRSFVGLIAIAFVVGVPIAYYSMDRWLQTFAYHIDVQFIYFLTAGAITLALVLITLAYQAIKIGRINPVQMLRSE